MVEGVSGALDAGLEEKLLELPLELLTTEDQGEVFFLTIVSILLCQRMSNVVFQLENVNASEKVHRAAANH